MSTNLVLRINAPTALQRLEEMRRGVDALAASLARMNSAGASSGGAGFNRLQSEVNELRAALKASQLEVERLGKIIEAQAARSVAAANREAAAVRSVNRARKKAAEEEEQIARTAAERKLRRLVSVNRTIEDIEAEGYRAEQMRAMRQADRMRELNLRGYRQMEVEKLRHNERMLKLDADFHNKSLAQQVAIVQRVVALQRLGAQRGVDGTEIATRRYGTAAVSSVPLLASMQAQLQAMREAERLANEKERIAQRVAAANSRANATAAAAAGAPAAAAAAAAAAGGGGRGGMEGTLRSAARGFAGAGGGLWLTYGQNIPALAGAFAVGMSVREGARRGSQFQYDTGFAGALGEMDPLQIASMRKELLKLGTDSIYGPLELAKAMRVLQQTGIEAAEALQILPVSMKVALQGETELTDAAETLVGVMRQYKLEIKDIPAIGDAISKTAAVTQANIKSLMEGLRAAVGLEQYGVDLNQSLAMMGMLAKQGIVGSSAGTFVRRMVEDMYMPKSLGAMRAMREIGFTPYNADGTRRDFRVAMADLMTRLSGYEPESQIKLMGEIFDIRGLKSATTLVRDLTGEFEKLRALIDNSKGSLDVFWNALSGETRSEWQKAKNNLEKALIEAFQEVEPELNNFVKLLRDAFKTESVRAFFDLALRGFVAMAEAAKPVLELLKKLDEMKGKSLAENAREGLAAGLEAAANHPFYSGIPSFLGGLFGFEGVEHPMAKALRFGASKLRGPQTAPTSASNPAMPGAAFDRAAFQMDPSVYNFRAGEMAGSTGSPSLLAPKKKASQQIIDPLGFKSRQDWIDALERDAMARLREDMQRADKAADYAQRINEEKFRGALITESEYNREVERLNDERIRMAIQSANRELEILNATKQEQATEDQKRDTERKIREAQARRDALIEESNYQKELARIKREGAANLAEIETRTLLRKHAEEGDKFRRGIFDDLGVGLMPAEVAAQYAAEQATRDKFLADLRKLDEDIAKKGAEGDDGEIKKLRERRDLLKEVMEWQVKLNGESARVGAEIGRSWRYGANQGLREFADRASNAAEQTRAAWTSALEGTTQALTRFVMTGKLSFADLANSIVEMLVRIRMERMIAGIVDQFILPAFNSGGIGYGEAGTAAGTALVPDGRGGYVPALHTGGIVGGSAASYRHMPLSFFAYAPRYHGGGIVGPDEQPIIARKGEGVFTPEQMAHLAPVGSQPTNVRVEVVNQGTPQKVVSATPQFDAHGLVIRVVTQDLQTNGPIARTMQNRFGLEHKAMA